MSEEIEPRRPAGGASELTQADRKWIEAEIERRLAISARRVDEFIRYGKRP